MFKKVTSIICLIAILFVGTTTAFATNSITVNVGGTEIEVVDISDDQYMVVENGERTLVTTTENENEIITELKNLDTDEVNRFVRDEANGTFYSSITGETIPLDDEINMVRSRASGDVYLGTKRMSYKTIAHIAGQTARAATMASAILAYYGAIGAKTAVLVTVLTTFGDLVASELAHRYPRGGHYFKAL